MADHESVRYLNLQTCLMPVQHNHMTVDHTTLGYLNIHCKMNQHRLYIWPLNVEPPYNLIGNLFNKRIYVEMTVLSGECKI